MTPSLQIFLVCAVLCVLGTAYLAATAPEIHPDDEDGFSDAEREEIEAVRDHEGRGE